MSTPAPARSELVPLADRMVVLQGVRLAMAAAAVLAAVALPHVAGRLDRGMVAATALYASATLAVEGVRRWTRIRGIGLVNLMVLADGVWLALVLAGSGGPHSLLAFLMHLHVVAVTLLVSYRTGLKVTAWHTLLLFASYFASAGGFTAPVDADHATVHALGLWVIAIGTAAFSWVSERELRRGQAELRAHAEMATQLEDTRNAEEVASLLLAHAVRFFGFRRGAVVLRREAGNEARVREGDVEVVLSSSIAVMDEVVLRAWERRAPLLVRALDEEHDAFLAAALPLASNVVVVPMKAGGMAVGALVLERGGGADARIRGRVVAAVAKLAAHAALALRNAALLDQVGKLAHTDSLTGLANRRVFEDALVREVARSKRTGTPVSLVLLDVDHFKAVNDSYGHQCGDEVLRAVARTLAEACREGDLPARYGGEEFAVLLPDCLPREAYRVAQRLATAVRTADLPVAVTISAGVAGLPMNAATADALLTAADTALYAAKNSGRDCITRARQSRRARRGHRRRNHVRPAPPGAARRTA